MPARGGWEPADYYSASRAARAAWQATDQQLTIGGLEDAQPSALRILEPAPSPSLSPEGGGLTTGAAEPCCAYSFPRPTKHGSAAPSADGAGGSVAPLPHIGPHRTEHETVRGGGQEVNPTMLQRILHPGVRTW